MVIEKSLHCLYEWIFSHWSYIKSIISQQYRNNFSRTKPLCFVKDTSPHRTVHALLLIACPGPFLRPWGRKLWAGCVREETRSWRKTTLLLADKSSSFPSVTSVHNWQWVAFHWKCSDKIGVSDSNIVNSTQGSKAIQLFRAKRQFKCFPFHLH